MTYDKKPNMHAYTLAVSFHRLKPLHYRSLGSQIGWQRDCSRLSRAAIQYKLSFLFVCLCLSHSLTHSHSLSLSLALFIFLSLSLSLSLFPSLYLSFHLSHSHSLALSYLSLSLGISFCASLSLSLSFWYALTFVNTAPDSCVEINTSSVYKSVLLLCIAKVLIVCIFNG